MFKIEDCLAFLANRISKELAEILEKRLSPAGVTRVQWMALYYISNSGDMTQNKLAEDLGIKGPSAVRLLDRMEKDGLVKRIRKDRRSNALELTEKGRDIFLKGLKITEQFKDDAVRDIQEDQLELFKRVLEKMVENTKQPEI